MKRAFNFLGREDLTTLFVATYVPDQVPPQLNLRLRDDPRKLASYPRDTVVQLEIHGGIISHVDIDGGLAALVNVDGVNVSDGAIPRELNARVRVRLVDPRTKQILAHTRNVALDGQGDPIGNDSESLLNCVLSGTMGSVVWRVEWGISEERPRLMLNNQIPGLKEAILENPGYAGLLMPEIYRQVIQIILLQRYDADEGSPQGMCATEWIELAERHAGSEPPVDRNWEDVHAWSDKAVAAFSSKLKAADSVNKLFT
jgi:hypothetical protein